LLKSYIARGAEGRLIVGRQISIEAQRFRDAVQLLVAMGGGWWDAPNRRRAE
jgi:hypothetical protein